MATYQWVNRDTFSLDELVMYGSSRLGTYGVNAVLCDTVTRDSAWCAEHDTSTNPFTDSVTYFTAGLKQYEFTNHLGNVLLTLTDRHIPFYFGGVSYIAEVASAQDYYPFGMEMVGRVYNPALYRFGFNGKENVNEVEGVGDQIDYGMRGYDPRRGQFWSVDPLTKKYPELTPYQFASNTPLQAIDLDGLERFDVTGNTITIHMTYVAFCSRATGSVPDNLDVVNESKKTWATLNAQMQNVTYNLNISYDAQGNVASVTPGSTAYKVKFDVKVIELPDENSPEFQKVIAQPEFTGVYLFGPTEFKGANVTEFGPNVPALTKSIDLHNDNPKVENKEATFYDKNGFNFDDETHEDGHTLGLDHMGGNSGMASHVPIASFMDSYGSPAPPLRAPGQEPYDATGMMKYSGAPGSSVPKPTQILNILNSTDGAKKDNQ